MADKHWKQFERSVAKLFNGSRYHANQGGRVDVESGRWVIQCKERRSLSLEQLTQLVEEMDQIGSKRGKLGLVCTKVRRGSGHKSPVLVVMSGNTWVEYNRGRV